MALSTSLKEHFQRMFAYDQWGNDLLLKDIEALPTADPIALAKLSHILTAEEMWLARILGEDLSRFSTPFTDYSLDECRQKLTALNKKFSNFFENLPDEDLGKIISYKNTKGQPYQLPMDVILGHIFDHSTYHRGQIATAIKKAGGQPHSPGLSFFALGQGQK